MRTLKEYAAILEEAIGALPMPRDTYPTLYDPIRYALSSGGKRLRPVLTLMAAEACAKGDIMDNGVFRQAMQTALAVEVFHNFTLLHDDIMDRSDLRRGRPTVHVKYNEAAAILSGDTMLTYATMLAMNVDDTILRDVLATFNQGAMDVYHGQALDMAFESRELQRVTIDEYISMISLKTGALLATALKLGALVAHTDSVTATALYDFGMALGIAFQIRDDYLDIYGATEAFGKPCGADVACRKKGYMALMAVRSDTGRGEMMKIYSGGYSPSEEVEAARRLYDSLGMEAECTQAIKQYSDRALAMLAKADISPEGRAALTALTHKLTGRTF